MLRKERIEQIESRHLNRAEKAEREAESRFKYVEAMAGVMNGQPVLIGHHSERGHRRDLERMDSALHRGVEASRLADKSRSLAAGAECTGIACTDDDAQSLLAEKIAKLEAKQAHMKHVNAQWRKHKDVSKMDVSDATKSSVERWLATREYSWQKAPFEGYQLSNNNANIKRYKARQGEIEQRDEIPDGQEIATGTCEGKEFRFITDTTDDRVRFESPRLSKEACKILRQNGFKWSPSRNAWIRLLNQNAIGTVRHYLAAALEKL